MPIMPGIIPGIMFIIPGIIPGIIGMPICGIIPGMSMLEPIIPGIIDP